MRKTQLIELDLRSGIVANDSRYVVGPRLATAVNAVFNYRWPRTIGSTGIGPWGIRQPITFPLRAATTYTLAKSMRDIGFSTHGSFTKCAIIGCNTSDQYAVWPDTGGSEVSFATGVTRTTVSASNTMLGCSAAWLNPGNDPRGAITTGTIDMDYAAATKTITRGSGSFLTDGFGVGDTIVVSDSTSNDGTYTVTVATALVLTVSQALVDETVGTSTITLNPTLAAGTSVLVFSHPRASKVYYLLSTSGATIRSLTDNVTNCPSFAAALAVYLDRLWLLEGQLTGQSKLWYTDPLDLDSIRTTNVIQVPDCGTCLVPAQFGAIDTSGVPHLIIGCANSIYVLDGDPQLGGGLQADLRTLSVGVGIANSHAAAVTPFGVFFIGSDGCLWHIPPGAQQMQNVGGPIENHLGVNNQTGASDIGLTASKSQLAWFPPYLYLFPGGETAWAYVVEVRGQEGLAFWGPVTLHSDLTTRPAVIATPPHNMSLAAPSGPGAYLPSVHSVDISVTDEAARYLAFDQATTATGSYPNGSNLSRTCRVRSGLLNVPGHRVQARRVILEVVKVPATSTPATVAWSVDVYDEQGNTVAGVLTPESTPASGTYDPDVTMTLHFAIPALTASRGVAVRISATAEANLGLQRAFVELATSPAQF